MSYTLPEKFGNYVLQEKIHEGWSADIYKASRKDLTRPVALKVLHPDQGNERIKRLQHEAEILGRLRHHQIVHVHEIGTFQEFHYLAMNYIDGIRLYNLIQSKEVSIEDMVKVARELTNLVCYLHENHIIHRDIKPTNVIVDLDENPHLVGFGLARLVNDVQFKDTIIGVPPYMSPEQTTGKPELTGPKTDIWGLGVTYYEMVVGKPPFESETPQGLYQQINHEDPPAPRSLIPEIPHDLETIVLKSIEKKPGERYENVSALVEDMDRYLKKEKILAKRPPLWLKSAKKYFKKEKLIDIAGGVLLLIFGAIGFYLYFVYFIKETPSDNEYVSSSEEKIPVEQNEDWIAKGKESTNKKEYKEALGFFEKAIESNPDSPDAYMERAKVYIKLQETPLPEGQQKKYNENAIEDLTKVISISSQSIDAYLLRASIYKQQKKYQEAINDYNKVVAKNPNSVDALFALGEIYLEIDILDKAISNLELGIELSPRSAILRLRIAQAYIKKADKEPGQKEKNLSKAMEQITKLISIGNNGFDTLYLRGLIYLKMDQYKEAIVDWEACLNIDPNNNLAPQIRKYLEELKNEKK